MRDPLKALELDANLGARRPVITHLADVQPENVKWMWPGWLPLGKIALLDGDPGLGKSTQTLDLAGFCLER